MQASLFKVFIAGVTIALQATTVCWADGLPGEDEMRASGMGYTEEVAEPPSTSKVSSAKVSAEVSAKGVERQSENSPPPILQADEERKDIAIAHFSRAYLHLNEALREFDEGRKEADPSAFLEVKKFRATIQERGKELEKLLDPRARESNRGIRLQGNPTLLGKGLSDTK